MALSDFQTLIRQLVQRLFPDEDVTAGSRVDTGLVQPLLRRLGSDPFDTDVKTFIEDTLRQEFPETPYQEGDALSDLVVKINTLILEPVAREIRSVKNQLSFRDPATLTLEEAEALAANYFAAVDRGQTARGMARLYYAQPQAVRVTPANVATSRGGLRFFPTTTQAIRPEEMVFNREDDLYYFDVNLQAEAPGDQYNIEPLEIVRMRGITYTKIANKNRFLFGKPADDAVTLVGNIGQGLTEKSMVSAPGIRAILTNNFQDITRLGIVGHSDPEMSRDVIRGGGLGTPLVLGTSWEVIPDGTTSYLSRRLRVLDTDIESFLEALGPAGDSKGFVITVYGAFGVDNPPALRDLDIVRVLDDTTVEVAQQELVPETYSSLWTIRRRSISLGHIPGGILFPNGPNGTLEVNDGEVHVGGMVDVYVRGNDVDTGTLVIDALVDESPLLKGRRAECINASGQVELKDYIVGTSYAEGSPTYRALEQAKEAQWTLQITSGPDGLAGSYRVVDVIQVVDAHPILTVVPAPLAVPGDFLWRLLDILEISLTAPRDIKAEGRDLFSAQNSAVVDTKSGVDFHALGVGKGDTLLIENGPDREEYPIVSVQSPYYSKLELDRKLRYSTSNLSYKIYRKNSGGGISTPLVRITSIDLLDASGQPVGSKIPYAKPIDGRSRAFANTARGVKWEVHDARLGICSRTNLVGTIARASLNDKVLRFRRYVDGVPELVDLVYATPGVGILTLEEIIEPINTAFGDTVAVLLRRTPGADPVGFGIRPTRAGGKVELYGGNAMPVLFPTESTVYSTSDICSATVVRAGGWDNVQPNIDDLVDVADVLDGSQVGHIGGLSVVEGMLDRLTTNTEFFPELDVWVRVGARSIGSARAYFLEPTSIEIDSNTRVSCEVNGQLLEFMPDPTLSRQVIPALPNGTKPKDGAIYAFGVDDKAVMDSASIDFVRYGVRPGDTLVIDYQPVRGTVALPTGLPDPIVGLVTKKLILSLAGGSKKEIIFVRDSTSVGPTSVTRAGVVTQINQGAGRSICSLVLDGGNYYLEFEPDVALVISAEGSANSLLGFSTTTDTENASFFQGHYEITEVFGNGSLNRLTLGVDPATFTQSGVRLQFRVERPGSQRIIATTMNDQVAETGLYYWDVELMSMGTGDLYNIPADVEMTFDHYRSDGYWLETRDISLAFSPLEEPVLRMSRSILEVGVNDDPLSTTQLSGQKVQVNYEYSSLVQSSDTFARSDDVRPVNSNPLIKHLQPHFVRLDLEYAGNIRRDVLLEALTRYIERRLPTDFLESSDLIEMLTQRGATSVTNPLTILAVVHKEDRSVVTLRSQNQLNIGRLAAFFADVINIKRLG